MDHIRNLDAISKASYENLHFKGDANSKTLLGGFFTLTSLSYVVYIGFFKGLEMINYDNPTIISTDFIYDLDNEHPLNLTNMNLLIFSIMSNKNPNKVTATVND